MNTHWQHFNPVKVHAGPGSFNQLSQYLQPGNWLLVTTQGATRRGLTARVQQQLGDQCRLLVCDSITPNPELDDLDKLTGQYVNESLDGLIALGGGSVLDAAKVLSVTLPSGLAQPLAHSLRGGAGQAWVSNLPVVAIPTTSGTGSEVTPFATVWDQTHNKKHSVTGSLVYPCLAVLDPELTLTLPHDDTLYTGLDATSHALESLWNKNRTLISQAFAWQALSLVVPNLPIALTAPNNLVARTALQQASLLAGLAISQTRTAIAHSISYPLTSHHGVPHGLACSFTLPAIIDRYLLDVSEAGHKQLLQDLQKMLISLQMPKHLQRFLNEADVKALIPEMQTPDRAGNFVLQVSVDSILDSSLLR